MVLEGLADQYADVPVPRSIVDLVAPEATRPVVDVLELGENRVLGSLEHIPLSEAPHFTHTLAERGYKWLVPTGRSPFCEVFYFKEPSPQVMEAIRFRCRDLGYDEPPLTLSEHMSLAGAFGIDEDRCRSFAQRVLTAMRAPVARARPPDPVDSLFQIRTPSYRSTESAAGWGRANARTFGFEPLLHLSGGSRLVVKPAPGTPRQAWRAWKRSGSPSGRKRTMSARAASPGRDGAC